MRAAVLLALLVAFAGVARAAEICPALPARNPLPPAATPAPLDFNGWAQASANIDGMLSKVDRGSVELVFVGDSITASWDPPIFRKFFGPLSPLLLGLGGDQTQGMLYRLGKSELAGLHPQVLVLLAGTNNAAAGSPPEDTALGIAEILRLVHRRSPRTRLLLLAILPRGPGPSDRLREVNDRVNALIRNCADNQTVFWYDAAPILLDASGQLTKQMSFDYLHLTPDGYYQLGQALEPVVRQLMGR